MPPVKPAAGGAQAVARAGRAGDGTPGEGGHAADDALKRVRWCEPAAPDEGDERDGGRRPR